MSIQIYLKYKYTYHDDFKILKFFNKLSKFFPIFHRGTSQVQPLPQRLYDVSRGQNRYVTLP